METESERQTTRSNCRGCGASFDRPVYLIAGTEFFAQRDCSACLQKFEADALARANKSRLGQIREAWIRFCPARYRDCNSSDFLHLRAGVVRKVLDWRPSQDGRGLGLVGPAHLGKRRLLFSLAKDLFFNGLNVGQIGSIELNRFGSEDESIRGSARRSIERVRSARILIFSDLGNEKLTERTQVELCSLIEFRAQNNLPILWATPFSGEQLAAKFGSLNPHISELARGRGRAAIGRLDQCSDVIKVQHEGFGSASPAAANKVA